MKYLALALFFCVLPSNANAVCSRNRMPLQGITHCQDEWDKTWHAVGSKWRNSACMDCSCGGCCQAYLTPVDFPEDCVSVFDAGACKYKVHMRDDPSTPCPRYSAVGK
ncbi:prostate-associated microseminoprotein-like [Lampris incognitus]|uniref:prostate-associated microseminoprotein-like n=1 Tax=Lampris incognitus TaxID=2546036 RepID=UPI0024B4F756|nr:prostate-associated microseminoprotein-like [Lampris incognitus]